MGSDCLRSSVGRSRRAFACRSVARVGDHHLRSGASCYRQPQREEGTMTKPAVPNPCSVCGFPIYGSTVGTGDGSMRNGSSFAHPECYWRDEAEKAHKEIRRLLREMRVISKRLSSTEKTARRKER